MSTVLDPAVRHEPQRVVELGDDDRDELRVLVDADPLVNVVVAARLESLASLSPRRFGGQLLGVRDERDQLIAAAFNGGNLLPIGGTEPEWEALARFVGGRRRVCSSMVGRVDAIETMWRVLEPVWGPARAIRLRQPLLRLDRAVVHRPPDAGLRRVRPDELDAYLPAATAMFTEELGVAPFENGGQYRSRVGALIRDGRAYAVVRGGAVVFKADFGAVSSRTCQIQGVWTRPDLRGRGLGTAAMVGVLDHALAAAPVASLYVNDFNLPARRMYERLGMTEVAALTTILL
jgi:predicted GNAT family acetyltransferase